MGAGSEALTAGPALPPPETPFRPQCSTYTGQTRCARKADGWLIAPDGKPNPGGYVCRAHGEAVIAEYAEKLREWWSLAPLRGLLGS